MSALLYASHLVIAALGGLAVGVIVISLWEGSGGFRKRAREMERERQERLEQFKSMAKLVEHYASTPIPAGQYLVVHFEVTTTRDFYSAVRLLLRCESEECIPAVFDSNRQLVCYKSRGVFTAPDVLSSDWARAMGIEVQPRGEGT